MHLQSYTIRVILIHVKMVGHVLLIVILNIVVPVLLALLVTHANKVDMVYVLFYDRLSSSTIFNLLSFKSLTGFLQTYFLGYYVLFVQSL